MAHESESSLPADRSSIKSHRGVPDLIMHELPWPFGAPETTTCYADARVLSGQRPILLFVCESDDESDGYVYHAMTGDDEDLRAENIAVVCLSHVVGLDPTLRHVADLPLDWWATRESEQAEWKTEPIPEGEAG